MASRAILRKAILAGLVSLCGVVWAVSQQSEPDRVATGRQTEMTKPVAVYMANANAPDAAPHENGSKQASLERGDTLWSMPLTSLAATRERPIFAPTRRPRPTVVRSVPTQAPLSAQPPLALVGAIAGENEGIAIFLDGTTKGVIRLKTGESHAGWMLQAVKPREAVLQKEQKNAILTLPTPPLR